MTDPTTQPTQDEGQSPPPADADGEVSVARGELVDGAAAPESAESSEESAEVERREAVEEPAKVLRIGSMVKQLLEEVRSTDLDPAARHRLREIYDVSIQELGSALSPDLRAELERVAFPFGDGDEPSDAELRMAKAQLVGWLEGLFHGIQATMRQQLAQGAPPGMRGPSDSGDARSGTYL
jgi:hypothetical protein